MHDLGTDVKQEYSNICDVKMLPRGIANTAELILAEHFSTSRGSTVNPFWQPASRPSFALVQHHVSLFTVATTGRPGGI